MSIEEAKHVVRWIQHHDPLRDKGNLPASALRCLLKFLVWPGDIVDKALIKMTLARARSTAYEKFLAKGPCGIPPYLVEYRVPEDDLCEFYALAFAAGKAEAAREKQGITA